MGAGGSLGWQGFPAIPQFFHDDGQGGILHFVHGQAMRFKGAVAAHVVGDDIAQPPSLVKAGIVKEVARSHEVAVGHLEAKGNDPGWAVEATGIGLEDRDRHEGAVVGAAHPAGHNVGHGKGFQDFPHGGKLALGADNTDGVVFAYILAGNQGQAFGGGDGGDVPVLAVNCLYHETAGRADEDQEIV